MNELTAPKDPEQRPYFYIMRDKDIYGSKQEDGRGIQFIYENNGRLTGSAQFTGNLSDEHMLDLLRSAKGFYRLVHSIGIFVETGDDKEKVEFIFQMYGKKDLLYGGTNMKTICFGDGREARIYLADISFAEDDDEPGQIRFRFDRPERMAKASVRFYLNDGFEAPCEVYEEKVDVSSCAYKEMIERSLMSIGDTVRLDRVIRKARQGNQVTMAYIGGSITQGAGAVPINSECYAHRSYRLFADKIAAQDNVLYVKAGVGGTPSELGMIRFERDIIRDGLLPDIVVVEFAVNDAGDETKGDCFESLLRKILMLPNRPAVILLFSVFADDLNLQERLALIGRHYALPMVSIKDAVTPQFTSRMGEGKVISKNQFFYDAFHPSNAGHSIMADCLFNLFSKVDREISSDNNHQDQSDTTARLLRQRPLVGNTFEKVKLLDRCMSYVNARIDCGSFTETDTVLQSVEMDSDLKTTPQFPYNWMHDGTKTVNAHFSMEIYCKALVLIFKDSGEPDTARAEIVADKITVLTADPRINGWCHCNPAIILNEKTSRMHNIEIHIAKGDEKKKFTILGFGYVI